MYRAFLQRTCAGPRHTEFFTFLSHDFKTQRLEVHGDASGFIRGSRWLKREGRHDPMTQRMVLSYHEFLVMKRILNPVGSREEKVSPPDQRECRGNSHPSREREQ
ncbi:hypothetical protein K439DRAFT_570286 [Ramaria rubella]|nr:hypothetical protein K439DRAFT_570286 [Ramaria rubella]